MPPPKGKSNNPNGRPKGKPNKTTAELRQWVIDLLSHNRTKLAKDLMSIPDPAERWKIVTKILDMVLPKPPAEIVSTINSDVAGMTREELETELSRLSKLTDPDNLE